MSAVIVVKVSEDIVLTADSAATLMGEINGLEGTQKETPHLGSLDTGSLDTQQPEQDIWQQVAREILQENASLWERLAKL